jgi:hypothetical protein
MVRLFILLGPDIFMAGVAEIGLPDLQRPIRSRMDGMTVVARYAHGLMLADIPRSQMF